MQRYILRRVVQSVALLFVLAYWQGLLGWFAWDRANGWHKLATRWPWVVAGDAGRVAVAWDGTSATGGPSAAKGDWFVYATTVIGADAPSPRVYDGPNARVIWPRISPSGFFAVWTLTYVLRASMSLISAVVTVAVPVAGEVHGPHNDTSTGPLLPRTPGWM